MIRGGHAIVRVSDVGRALRFYVETLGFKLLGPASATWAEVDAGEGLVIALAGAGDAKAGVAGSVTIGLVVNQPIGEVAQVLANRGVVFDGPVREMAGRRMARFTDPDGNALALVESA